LKDEIEKTNLIIQRILKKIAIKERGSKLKRKINLAKASKK
jgi:hypothetical protein